MDYTTSITWHTDFPKIGPGYAGAHHCFVIIAHPQGVASNGKRMPDTLNLKYAFQEDDGTWGYLDENADFHPYSEIYPDGFKIMAWGEFGVSVDAVDDLCCESNRVNYGVVGKRDYALTELYLDRYN